MKLNPRKSKTEKYTVNPEGFRVYKGAVDLELFLMASNLKPSRTFYESEPVLKFMEFVRQLPKSEIKWAKALARYLAQQGIKLAPVVMLSVLAENGKYTDKYIDIFDRPDKIANYVYLTSLRTNDGKHFSGLSKWEKVFLRKALEQMKPHTLKKMQLTGRTIKLRDLIKMLRPKPANETLAETYKAIIENRAKVETLLTKRSQDDEAATEYFEQNIDKMPVNMLIRNLRKYKQTKNPIETRRKILDRLMKIPLSEKVVNPFDFVSVALEEPSLELEMTALIKRFVTEAKFNPEGRTVALFDVSYSMEGRGFNDGFENLVLLTHILGIEDIWFFQSSLIGNRPEIIKLIKQGEISRAKKAMIKPDDGTGMLESLETLVRKHPEYDNIVLIGDEVTWVEGAYGRQLEDYTNAAHGKKLIAINPVKYEGTTFRDKFLALASIDAKLMLSLRLLVDWKGFKQTIIAEYGD